MDLAASNTESGDVTVFLRERRRARLGFTPPVSFAAGRDLRGLSAADFDADGRADLAVANSRTNDIHVLLNRCR
jgi:hypothetical protein